MARGGRQQQTSRAGRSGTPPQGSLTEGACSSRGGRACSSLEGMSTHAGAILHTVYNWDAICGRAAAAERYCRDGGRWLRTSSWDLKLPRRRSGW
jgi:hypothetical protein